MCVCVCVCVWVCLKVGLKEQVSIVSEWLSEKQGISCLYITLLYTDELKPAKKPSSVGAASQMPPAYSDEQIQKMMSGAMECGLISTYPLTDHMYPDASSSSDLTATFNEAAASEQAQPSSGLSPEGSVTGSYYYDPSYYGSMSSLYIILITLFFNIKIFNAIVWFDGQIESTLKSWHLD